MLLTVAERLSCCYPQIKTHPIVEDGDNLLSIDEIDCPQGFRRIQNEIRVAISLKAPEGGLYRLWIKKIESDVSEGIDFKFEELLGTLEKYLNPIS